MSGLQAFDSSWSQLAPQYNHAVLRILGINHDGMKLSQGLLVFGRDAPIILKDEVYDKAGAFSTELPIKDAVRFVREPSHWEHVQLLHKFVRLQFEAQISADNFEMSDWPLPLGDSRGRITGWPERSFTIRCPSGVAYVNGPFFKAGLPIYGSIEGLASRALGIDRRLVWTHQTGIRVVLPDYRFGFAKLSIRDGSVHVQAKGDGVPGYNIGCRILILRGQSEIELEVRKLGDFDFDAPLGALPEKMLVFLSDSLNGTVLDWADIRPLEDNDGEQFEVQYGTDDLEALISKGEGQTLEFKASAEKRDDILESLSSFANSGGGRILVGVEDSGNVAGIPEVAKTLQKLEAWAQNLIEPRLTVQTFEGTIGGKKIAVVHVPEGAAKPYLLRNSHLAFVRHGANDQRATRAELSGLFGKVESLPPPLG